MADPEGYVTKVDCTADSDFKVYLDDGSGPLFAVDLLVQQTVTAALAVQEKVILPLKDGLTIPTITRVQRAMPIAPHPRPDDRVAAITGIATQTNAATGNSHLEVFLTKDGKETQVLTQDPAVVAVCLTACIMGQGLEVESGGDNYITRVVLEKF